MPGAFAKSIARDASPRMLWQHNSDQPIGVWDELEEQKKGLYVKGRILDTAAGNDAYKLVKAGAINGPVHRLRHAQVGDRQREGRPQADRGGAVRGLPRHLPGQREGPDHPGQVRRRRVHDRARLRGIPTGRRRTEPEGSQDRGFRRLQGLAEAPGRWVRRSTRPRTRAVATCSTNSSSKELCTTRNSPNRQRTP